MTDTASNNTGDKVIFYDYHRPQVPAGNYQFRATQTLDADGKSLKSKSALLQIRFQGPQFHLPAGAVTATYPAPNAAGAFDRTVPHISLRPSTLPWERKPHDGDTAPWLVLLVLSDSEFRDCSVENTPLDSVKDEILCTGDDQDSAPTALQILTIPEAYAREFMPERSDLPWLAHVRGTTPETEVATILSCRLPAANQLNHAFLISVESRYMAGELSGLVDAKSFRFPILHRWSFSCQSDVAHDFSALLKTDADGQQIQPLELFYPGAVADETYRAFFDDGAVPMAHHAPMRKPEMVLYRGPLIPRNVATGHSLAADAATDPTDPINADFIGLKAGAEDQEIPHIGHLAAWELGRLVALENADIAAAIFAWNRRFKLACRTEVLGAGIGPEERLERVAEYGTSQEAAMLPENIANWIDTHLFSLRDVPFNYLIPDEAMLPPRSLRLFDVDEAWLHILRNGALSIGQSGSLADDHRALVLRALKPVPPRSGFLLRSELANDFPDVCVDAYPLGRAPAEGGTRPLPDPLNALSAVRLERLSKSVMFGLFEGLLGELDFYMPAHARQFELPQDTKKAAETLNVAGGPHFRGPQQDQQARGKIGRSGGLENMVGGNFHEEVVAPAGMLSGMNAPLVPPVDKRLVDDVRRLNIASALKLMAINAPDKTARDDDVAQFAKCLVARPHVIRIRRTAK